ncbi:MAG: ABC transporter permease [Acidobacteria bacterium]|nr:ABC transporter permease [Acidobacteriota bacterium]
MGPVRLGYQIFDAQAGSLVLDGERVSLPAECGPGSRSPLRAELNLPAESGRYRIVLAPVHEQVAWFHERGSEFVEVKLETSGDQVAILSVRCMTGFRRRAARLWQMLLRSFYYPLRTVARHRVLIASMVRREMQGRYRGSMAGAWWTLLQPLLLMLAYYFVFGIVLKAGGTHGAGAFVFYFLCGTVPWLGFSEAVARAPNIVVENSNFVKRVIFPLEILPVNLTLMGLVSEGFALAIFLTAVITLGPGVSWAVLYFPAVLIPQLLFTAGLCWFLAALGVFLRDTGQIMSFLLTIWFFATPIVYYAEALPQRFLWLFRLNPMYTIVGAYRNIFLEHSAPHAYPLALLWLLSLAVFWFGHSWFYKMKKSFADLI